jgi:4-amino-4-deoxy-L-arabinose transferase-like glycosyltransferase
MLNKKSFILLLFILAKFILQYLLIHPSYDLHRDEYLHLDQAKHLAWGFDSVPPFTSWIAYIILQLGDSVFWVKFFPALFGALTIVLVWKAVERLGGNLFAQVLSAMALLLSVLLRLNILFQPNSFDVIDWPAFYYCMLLFIQTEKDKWLYAAAVVFAVGFLNKYNIAFLLIGTVPAVLLTKYRNVFANLHLYVALLMALLIVMPNLFWQFRNGLPVIHHMKELAETQLVNVKRIDFVKGQLLFFLGSFFILIAAWVSFFAYQPFRKFKVFFWSFVFTMALFIYLKAKAYYAIGAYPIFFAFGVVYLEQLLNKGWLKYLRPVALLIPVFFIYHFY